MRERVIQAVDRKYLNEEIEHFSSVVPTTENLGLFIHDRLKRYWEAAFPGEWPRLEKVRIAASVAQLEILGVAPSRLPGAEGNLEYFLHARRAGA